MCYGCLHFSCVNCLLRRLLQRNKYRPPVVEDGVGLLLGYGGLRAFLQNCRSTHRSQSFGFIFGGDHSLSLSFDNHFALLCLDSCFLPCKIFDVHGSSTIVLYCHTAKSSQCGKVRRKRG